MTPTKSARDPAMELLQQEKARHEERVLGLLLEASDDDPLVLRIIQTMQDGHEKPGDIATVLGIDVSDVYNAIKRLERKIIHLRQRIQEQPGRA